MSIKVYCLKYPEDCGCDPDMTLSIHKAMEWLEQQGDECQVLEYMVSNDGIEDQWQRCWYFHEGKIQCMITKDYFD